MCNSDTKNMSTPFPFLAEFQPKFRRKFGRCSLGGAPTPPQTAMEDPPLPKFVAIH